MYGDDGAARVVLAGEEHFGLELFQLGGELLDFLLDFGADALALAGELE